jgi:hypothetical protein
LMFGTRWRECRSEDLRLVMDCFILSPNSKMLCKETIINQTKQ